MSIIRKLFNVKILATVGVIGILLTTAVSLVVSMTGKVQADPVTTSGNWSDYADGGWLNVSAPRYDGYGATPGSSEEYPYLVETPAELAYLGTVGQTGQFAGKYIKLSRGCNCDEALMEMDFSAHYWDPVYLYGGAYGSMYDEAVVAHIDGGNVKLKGIKINHYVKTNYSVTSCENDSVYASNNCIDEDYTPPGDEANYLEFDDYYNYYVNVFSDGASGAGLFGELYKARVANFNLVAPEIITTTISDIVEEVNRYDSNDDVYFNSGLLHRRQEAVGGLVGSARRTRILDNQITSPNIQVSEPYLSQVFATGGLIGYASGYVYTINNQVSGGSVGFSIRQADALSDWQYFNNNILSYGQFLNQYGGDFDDYHDYMNELLDGVELAYLQTVLGLKQGGLIGMNYHSVVMNSSTTTKLKFDLSGMSYDERSDAQDYVDAMMANYPVCDEDNPTTDCHVGMEGLFYHMYEYTHEGLYVEPAGDGIGIGIGGLVGVSTDNTPIEACIFNSYANGDVEVVGYTTTDDNGDTMHYGAGPTVGGLVGTVNDVIINNYATLKLDIASISGDFEWGWSGENKKIGELFGLMDDENYSYENDDGSCSSWDEDDCIDFDEYWDDPRYYAVTDNYYSTGSTYPAIGGDPNRWENGRPYYTYYQECDPIGSANCWWDSREETRYYAESFSNSADLLAKLNAGLGDVERAVRGHLVSSNLLPPALADWWASKISRWTLNADGQPVPESQLVLSQTQPDNDCSWSKDPPEVPNTGQRQF